MMKYETPIMEIIYLDKQDDVITTSPTPKTRKLAFDTNEEEFF